MAYPSVAPQLLSHHVCVPMVRSGAHRQTKDEEQALVLHEKDLCCCTVEYHAQGVSPGRAEREHTKIDEQTEEATLRTTVYKTEAYVHQDSSVSSL